MAEINKERAIERFQTVIRQKTISDKDGNFDREVFEGFLPLLKEIYPDLFSTVEAQLINEFGILLRWKGKDSTKKPIILMGHYDVVSDKGQDWKHPAFEAEIHDGVMWGRGTIDNKCIICATFEAMESLIKEGFTPERDIYYASSNNEEVAGDTMPKIVEWFEENNITPWFVLDEGGAIMEELPMGIKKPHAMIALSEKGWATITLKAHKSNSKSKKSPPDRIIEAVNAIKENPTKATITPALEGMLGAFSDCMDAPLKQVFRNLGLFGPVVKKVMATIPDAAAMIRSEFILTKLEAGNEKGSVPDVASATFNFRLAPQDTYEEILTHIRKIVGSDIEIELVKKKDAPPFSDYKTDSFRYIEKTIKSVFPDVGVAPFVLNAGTDARHFSKMCKEVYRFGAFSINNELFSSVHNANERLPVDVYLKAIDFYGELIKNLK